MFQETFGFITLHNHETYPQDTPPNVSRNLIVSSFNPYIAHMRGQFQDLCNQSCSMTTKGWIAWVFISNLQSTLLP